MEQVFRMRTITLEDLSSMVELFNHYETNVFGEVQTSEEEIHVMLTSLSEVDRIGLFLEGDLVAISILTEKDHRLPALILAEPNEQMERYITVLAKELIDSAKKKKDQLDDRKTIILSANLGAEKRAFEKCGFTPTRFWYQMKKNLENISDLPLPSTYKLTSFDPESEVNILHEVFEEVFADHFDYHPSSIEEFQKRFHKPSFDPSLWYLLRQEDRVVGFVFCSVNDETKLGEITHLGIRRNWRRKGLAHYLLNHACAVLKEHGMDTAALSVDSESHTDAAIVYQKAGMYVYRGFTRYDLPI
ncbi:GNAT family N-acetyltransferase [Bacillus sp. BHET2]|uniref:GNAT family N-acetyltransferase n=1 Tax=Bacillus sp. BHET2 TaxID=2583818 RepID=UPI00110DBCDB|nr:GNAT family N-acetyltransferase [Bacillus sp. BHET2]TMU86965.1 GNAT family N-acetyltransferase [Bacillus sp. BHET2]